MECPIGGPRCFDGCAKGNLALNYSPMSYTTEGPSVPYNTTLFPCHRRRSGALGRAAPTRAPMACGMSPARRCSARGGQRGGATVGERLKGRFGCLQRVDERRRVDAALRRTSYTPNPRSPRDFGTPLSGRTDCLGGVLVGAAAARVSNTKPRLGATAAGLLITR